MTADHQSSEQPRFARLMQATLLLLVSATVTFVLAAIRGNTMLGMAALGAPLVPTMLYAAGRLRYRARRRRTETAALRYLRIYIDTEKSAWQESGDPTPEPARKQRAPELTAPRPAAAFQDMDAKIAPRVPDPVLAIFEAILPGRLSGVRAPGFPEIAPSGEPLPQATAAAAPEFGVSCQSRQHPDAGWVGVHPWLAEQT